MWSVSKKVAVLGSSLAEELFGESDPIGQTVTVGTTKLAVVGVNSAEKGLGRSSGFPLTPVHTYHSRFPKLTPSQFARIMGDRVRIIYVELEEKANLDNVILQIELLLAKRHEVSLEEADFTVTTQQDIISTQESTTSTKAVISIKQT